MNAAYYSPQIIQYVVQPFNNNTASEKKLYSNRERCEVLSGYLSLERRPGGDWVNTWHCTKRFTTHLSNMNQ
jgi:hypothetical protein